MRRGIRAIGTALAVSFRVDPWRAAGVFLLTPISGVLGALVGVWLKFITDGTVRGDLGLAIWGAVLCGATSVVHLAVALGGFTMSMRLREAADLEVDRRLIQIAATVPGIEHFERPEYMDRLELLRTGRSGLSQVVSPLAQALRTLVEIVTTAGVLFTVHPALATLPLFGVPSLIVATRSQRQIEAMSERLAEPRRQALHLFDAATTEGPAKEVRVFGLTNELVARHGRVWQEIHDEMGTTYVRVALVRMVGWSFFAAGFALAIGVVAREAVAGRATAGDVILATWVGMHINQTVGGVGWILGWLMTALKTVGRYLWLTDYGRDARAAVARPGGFRPTPDRLDGGVTLTDVGFAYPGTTDPVLRDVNLHLPAGATVAVVGDNGAGKSTLVKLLCRFYEPSEGSITVDGVPLADIDPDTWRARMSGGFQDYARFEVEALTTVGVGDLPHVDDRVAVGSALSRAASESVVSELPDGLDTMLGSSAGGRDLSGGQWQKLALGRAMMRERPLLLVLDEPTAAIDAETEHALFEAYADASRVMGRETGGITVLVSHRFSTVRIADLIVVVDGGRIAEAGTHAELMARAGPYAELYELQAGGYR